MGGSCAVGRCVGLTTPDKETAGAAQNADEPDPADWLCRTDDDVRSEVLWAAAVAGMKLANDGSLCCRLENTSWMPGSAAAAAAEDDDDDDDDDLIWCLSVKSVDVMPLTNLEAGDDLHTDTRQGPYVWRDRKLVAD